MKQIVCITGLISQPRFVKRVQTLLMADYDVTVYGYSRDGYNVNNLPKSIKVINKGVQKDGGDYLSKFIGGYKDVKQLTESYKGKDVVFYSFSFLTAFWFYLKRVNYIYEISDILYGYKKMRFIEPFVRFLDKRVIAKSVLTIMTSEGFRKYFFGEKNLANVLVQPNKVSSNILFEKRNVKRIGDSVNFSFIGAIRYFDTILRFAKVIGKKFPNHYFHFWGDSSVSSTFMEECKEYKNVIFHGRFRNPEDLDSIYSQTDIVVACYENSNLNERIAEPNKMYEAILFCKPVVVQKNTFVADRVQSLKCGYTIDAYKDSEIEKFVASLSRDEMESISKSDLSFDIKTLLDNPYVIIDRLQELS